MYPSNADIRQFILDTFNDEDFELFCADHFHRARGDFAIGMSLKIKAQKLIDYCQSHGLMGTLLSAFQRERPELYEDRFPPSILVVDSPLYLELVRVPAGEFIMGSDPAKYKDGPSDWEPQHRVYVSEFYIGKYAVANAQFAGFVRATHYQTAAEKTGMGRVWDGSQWNEIKGASWQHPHGPGSDVTRRQNHPVVQICWDDGKAFCDWLAQQSGNPAHLPTEAEWEKAARGTDERLFPWGNTWDPTKANTFEGGEGDTTPTGKYSPAGDSPYGAADMAGNVWEVRHEVA